jgi:hypothetical protein
MRKLTAICFAVLIATSAVASPRNESKDRDVPNPVTRIVREIKTIVVHLMNDPVAGVPIPATPSHQ